MKAEEAFTPGTLLTSYTGGKNSMELKFSLNKGGNKRNRSQVLHCVSDRLHALGINLIIWGGSGCFQRHRNYPIRASREAQIANQNETRHCVFQAIQTQSDVQFSGEIWTALNIEVLGADKGEVSNDGMQGRGKWEIPKKIRRPAASFGTIPPCEGQGAIPTGFEPGSLRREANIHFKAQIPCSTTRADENHLGNWLLERRVRRPQEEDCSDEGKWNFTVTVAHTHDFFPPGSLFLWQVDAHISIAHSLPPNSCRDNIRKMSQNAPYVTISLSKTPPRSASMPGRITDLALEYPDKLPVVSTAVSPLTSHEGEPGSVPGRTTPGFSQVGIVSDDAVGRRVFLGIPRIPHPCIPAQLHSHHILPSTALKTSLLRAARISQLKTTTQIRTEWNLQVLTHFTNIILVTETHFSDCCFSKHSTRTRAKLRIEAIHRMKAHRCTKNDENAAPQFTALREAEMGHLMSVVICISPLPSRPPTAPSTTTLEGYLSFEGVI
ncbi:hypothetical protein PR048_020355 [Dryococelus australis]|uniref:Uncharacterized protein n=1 Tax=Dryococelus australis TaxID=614101 RepID=A0ABQ9H664_9NEOP|nr:hypothetical protein PR048_020355 [Dryococelus australis]